MTTRRRQAVSAIGASPSREISVRMYNVGFGDAFLMTIPTPKGVRRVLIDCGSIKKGDGNSMKEVTEALVAAVSEGGEAPVIDVVIATHRHRDHIAGFSEEAWSRVTVGEVWLPWTEDPKDSEAKKIRDGLTRFTFQLEQVLGASKQPDQELIDVVFNAKTNASAMQTLLAGFDGNPKRRFLPHKDASQRTFQTTALPGVRIHVLGPSRNSSDIQDLNPPKEETYQHLMKPADLGEDELRPFSDGKWELTESQFNQLYPGLKLTSEESKKFASIGSDDQELLAAALDGAINGTSLMIIFQIGQTCLLFPGDAQWGTWRLAMSDPEWRELLKLTSFYKIGHHGSHNATPITFVEDLLPTRNSFSAMASVTPVAKWKHIPQPGLMNAIKKKSTRIVRSDKLSEKLPPGFTKQGNSYVEVMIPI